MQHYCLSRRIAVIVKPSETKLWGSFFYHLSSNGTALRRVKKLEKQIKDLKGHSDRKFFYGDKEDMLRKYACTLKSYLPWAEPLAEICLASYRECQEASFSSSDDDSAGTMRNLSGMRVVSKCRSITLF